MPSFDEAWASVANPRDGEPVSERLRPLLQAAYRQVLLEPLDTIELIVIPRSHATRNLLFVPQ